MDWSRLKIIQAKLDTPEPVYYPKLDSIRCFAVAAVVFAHIFQIWTWEEQTILLFPLGNTGVVIFFVLSGFLITSLLLAEPLDKPVALSFKQFYIRRTLRIFPAYYLYLVVIFAINFDDLRQAGIWPWVYLTNLFIFETDSWLLSNSHLWSLSVEEQFYLVWPFIVLFLRSRQGVLLAVFALICLTSVLTRWYLFQSQHSPSPQIEVFTLANLDFLAAGGVLAILQGRYRERLKHFGLPILGLGILTYYLAYWLSLGDGKAGAMFWALGKFGVALAGVGWLIYAIHSKVRTTLLHNPVTVHLGRISYGIYLYHNPIIAAYAGIMGFVGMEAVTSLWLKVPVCLALVLLVAELSYLIIERPLLRLKDRYR